MSRDRHDEPIEVQVQRAARLAQHPQAPGPLQPGQDGGGDGAGADDGWLRPAPGARVRQTVETGPFVVQRREDLGLGACRLTRHREAVRTSFVLLGYSQRSEVGLPCHVVHLRDEADGREYVVDTGLCGPGLPAEAFEVSAASP
jgi:hypothetical protein